MTFRIYGESGARCLTSGWYVCWKHPEVEKYFGERRKFTACPGPNNEQDEAHNTTWVSAELDAGGPAATKACPHCEEQIKRETTVCRFCGKDVDVRRASHGTDACRAHASKE